MGLIDDLKNLFSSDDESPVTQGAVIQALKAKKPNLAGIEDAKLATALAAKDPERFGYLKEFDPSAPVEPSDVPKSMRTEKFYVKHPDVGTKEALDVIERVKARYPKYQGVDAQTLAPALEQKFPTAFSGLTAKLTGYRATASSAPRPPKTPEEPTPSSFEAGGGSMDIVSKSLMVPEKPQTPRVPPPPTVAGEVVRGLPGMVAGIGRDAVNFAAEQARNALAASATEVLYGVKGASAGYVDPTGLLKKSDYLGKANISYPTAATVGYGIGMLAPAGAAVKVAGTAMKATQVFNAVRPALAGLFQAGLAGGIFGAARKPEEGQTRAQNALNDAAAFIAFSGALEAGGAAWKRIFSKDIIIPDAKRAEVIHNASEAGIDAFSKGASVAEARRVATQVLEEEAAKAVESVKAGNVEAQAIQPKGYTEPATKIEIPTSFARSFERLMERFKKPGLNVKGEPPVIPAETVAPEGGPLAPFRAPAAPASFRGTPPVAPVPFPSTPSELPSVDAGTPPDPTSSAPPMRPTTARVEALAKVLANEANAQRGDLTDLERFVIENGGVKANADAREEFKSVPVHLRGSIYVDEMMQDASDAGIDIPNDFYGWAERLKRRGEVARPIDFHAEAKSLIESGEAEGFFRPSKQAFPEMEPAPFEEKGKFIAGEQAPGSSETDQAALPAASSPQSTGQEPTTPPSASPGVEERFRTLFPATRHPSVESITREPNYVKLSNDAGNVVEHYAEAAKGEQSETPIERVRDHLHRVMHEMSAAARAKDTEKLNDLKTNFPDLQNEFMAVNGKLSVDKNGERYFKLFYKNEMKDEFRPKRVLASPAPIQQMGEGRVEPDVMGSPAHPGFISTPSRIPPAPIFGGEAKPLNKILIDVSKALDKSIIYGKPGRGLAGYYKPSSGSLIVRYSGDLDTTAHELAHALDDKLGITAAMDATGNPAQFDDELSQFWGHGSVAKSGPRSTPKYKRFEGIAEYVRAWLVNPDEAKKAAPRFSQFLESRLAPETVKALRSFGDDIRAFAGATARQQIEANVQWKPPDSWFLDWASRGTSRPGFGLTFWDRFKRTWVDDLQAFNKAVEFAQDEKGIGELLPKDDPRLLARLYAGINAKFDDILENGMIDVEGNRVTPGFAHMVEPLDATTKKSLNEDVKGWLSYMIAERTIEKAAQLGRDRISGIGGGVLSDVAVAKKYLVDLESEPAKLSRYKETSKRYRAMADAVLRYMVDGGRMSEESYQAIKKNNEQYVAMNRIMEIGPDQEIDSAFVGGSRGMGSAKNPVQEFKGSTRMIANPLDSLLRNIHRSVTETDRNRVMLAFRNLLTETRQMGQGETNELGSVGRLAKEGEPNSVSIFVDGKKERWQFQEDVYRALMGKKGTGGWLNGASQLPGFLTILPRILRTTITQTPPFALRNKIRDIQQRLQITMVGSGLRDEILRRGPMDVSELKRFGGDQAGHYMRDRVDYHRAITSAMQDIVKDKNTILAMPGKLWEGYGNFLEFFERSTRLVEYKAAIRKAKEKGMDDYNAHLFAAGQARSLMDFSVAGEAMRIINQLVPFSNAQVQGLRRTIEAAHANPKGFLVRWSLYALAPTLAVWLWNKMHGDGEEYRQLPAYRRNMFLNFKIGKDMWLTIPKSYELGVLAAGVESTLDYAMGNKKAYEGYFGVLANLLMPLDATSIGGPFQSVIEAMANRDLFRNRSIVPPHEEQLALAYRKTSQASRVGQLLQKSFGVDARKIDFLAGGLFGNVGQYVTMASDIGRKDRRALFSASTSGFASSSPGSNARDVQWVMDKARERGLTGTPVYKRFGKLRDRYFSAEGSDAKDVAARDLREAAAKIRAHWEEKPPLSNIRKINKIQREEALTR